jgi:N-acyl homoserine lactone hydrolase
MRIWLLFILAACAPVIPHRTLAQRAALPAQLPELHPCALVHLTQQENLSNAARGFFRGDFELTYTTFLIRHPRGVVLVDAAFGDTVAADLDAAPWWFRFQFGAARAAKPLSALLAEAGVKPEEVTLVLLTHAHWDHAGGLSQLPNARVLTADGWILAESGMRELAMPQHFAKVRDRITPLQFDGPAYDGFAASHDVFGDGSIVAVPTPGHTQGSSSYFVNAAGGKRWLFIGDAAWVKEGFAEPVLKGRLASTFADHDAQQAADTLGLLHAVYEAHAANLVTAHDPRTWVDLPRCSP